MVDWIAVLRAVDERLLLIDQDGEATVGWVAREAARAAADELERQRDAAQGTATVTDTSARVGTQEDRCAQPSPASSDEREEVAWKIQEVFCKYGIGLHMARLLADHVLAREGDLRAQLAEREAELAELHWCLRRMSWYASDRADGTAEQRLASAAKCAADFLAAHERARRAKETT